MKKEKKTFEEFLAECGVRPEEMELFSQEEITRILESLETTHGKVSESLFEKAMQWAYRTRTSDGLLDSVLEGTMDFSFSTAKPMFSLNKRGQAYVQQRINRNRARK